MLDSMIDDIYRRTHHVAAVLRAEGLSIGEHPHIPARILVRDHRGPLDDILIAMVARTPDYLQDLEDLIACHRLIAAFEAVGLTVAALPVGEVPSEVFVMSAGEVVDHEEAPGMLAALRALGGRYLAGAVGVEVG